MSKWETVKIDDIAEVRSGKRLPKGEMLISEVTPYPYIRLVDVADGRIQKGELQYLKEETRESIKRYIVNTNDVCLAIVGHTIGMVFFVEEEWNNVNLTENAARITNVDESFNPRFLYYYLTSSVGQNEIISRKVGSAQGKLPLYNIRSLEVPRMPRSVQDSIVSILDSLSFKIELNRQTNQTLEQIAQAIFKSWFVDFEPVKAKIQAKQNGQNPERAAMCAISGKSLVELEQLSPETQQQLKTTAGLFPDALVEFELGEIPEGWQALPLYETAEYVNGTAFKTVDFSGDDSGLPIIKITELKQGITSGTKYTNSEVKQKYFITNDDVLYSWSGSPETSLEVFKWFGGDGWLNQHIFKLNFECLEQKYFTYYLLKHMKPVLIATAQQKQTTGLGHVTVADMKRIKVPFPCNKLLREYMRYVSPMYEKGSNTEKESKVSTGIRDNLLPKLFSGAIEMPGEEVA